MISWWGNDSYINNELIQIGDIKNMSHVYGSLGTFVSIVRSKSIGHNTYTGRRINFCSKSAPINGLVHKSDLNYSYSRSNLSWLPQVVSKIIFFCLRRLVMLLR